jgi:DNA repair protein
MSEEARSLIQEHLEALRKKNRQKRSWGLEKLLKKMQQKPISQSVLNEVLEAVRVYGELETLEVGGFRYCARVCRLLTLSSLSLSISLSLSVACALASQPQGTKLQKQFGEDVCDLCRDVHYDLKYCCVTKTEAKEEYLLRDEDLEAEFGGLRCVERKNKRHESWSAVKLYLLAQVEEKSFARYGGEEGLEEELERKAHEKRRRKAVANEKQVKKLRKQTITAKWMSGSSSSTSKHVHEFEPEVYDADTDMWSKACTSCEFIEEYEKM